jgi:large repetitive protein
VGLSKQVSETQAHAGDLLTYSIAVTVTGNSATGLVVTDILPPDVTFTGFTASNLVAGTFTQATGILQWVMPSPLAVGVYTLSYQTTVNNFVPANTVILNKAQITSAGSLLPIVASVPVTTIGNFTVKVNVYNSAGEVVKTISVQVFSQPVNSITLSTSNTITTLNGPGSIIDIFYNGYLIGTWNGTNNLGQPVSNGNYSIQVDNMGQTGVVTSVAQTAIVNRSLANITANVYNEAGELVRTLYNVVSDPVGSTMNNVTLSSNILRPSVAAPAGGSTTNVANILIETSGTPVTLTWDGTNSGGTIVTPGVYTIAVHWNDGTGQTSDISREIIVMPGPGASGIAVARPNVLNATNGMTATFDATGIQNAYSIKVQVYTMTGQLVQVLTSPQGSPIVPWNATGMASGIYIAVMEVDNSNGGVISRQRLKVLLLH